VNRNLAGALIAVGCAGPGATPDTGPATGPLVALEGQITDLLTAAGVGGAEICVEGTGDCTTSDPSGAYRVRAPAEARVELVVTRADHRALLVPVQTQSEDATLRPLSLLPEGIIDAQASAVNATGDPALGQVVFSVSNGIPGDGVNVEGVEASLEPDSGVGPFYLGAIGLPDDALESTSANGGGGWMDVSPGDAALLFEDLPLGCFVLFGWEGPTPLRFRVRPAHATVLRIECPAAEADSG
jgi:hypothetical protein